MCERGTFMLPQALKHNHVNAAHIEADINRTLEATRKVLRAIPGACSEAARPERSGSLGARRRRELREHYQ
jgi:hypothetical protein